MTTRVRGFTLLEVVVAMAIMALSLMAIFEISSQALAAHIYAKRLNVATLLARSKMIDLEQELIDKGLSADDDEQAGDFSDEGWPSFKWRARIVAPQTKGLSPEQLLSTVFGLPMDELQSGEGGLGAIAGLFGAGKADPKGAKPPSGGGGAAGVLAAMGPAAGIAQAQFGQLVDTLTKSVREVRLTISWKEGKVTESFDVVTHVVSLGPGSDRNGSATTSTPAGATPVAGAPGTPGAVDPATTIPPLPQIQDLLGRTPSAVGAPVMPGLGVRRGAQ